MRVYTCTCACSRLVLAGMCLAVLDLTNYINVTDAGVESIAQIKRFVLTITEFVHGSTALS